MLKRFLLLKFYWKLFNWIHCNGTDPALSRLGGTNLPVGWRCGRYDGMWGASSNLLYLDAFQARHFLGGSNWGDTVTQSALPHRIVAPRIDSVFLKNDVMEMITETRKSVINVGIGEEVFTIDPCFMHTKKKAGLWISSNWITFGGTYAGGGYLPRIVAESEKLLHADIKSLNLNRSIIQLAVKSPSRRSHWIIEYSGFDLRLVSARQWLSPMTISSMYVLSRDSMILGNKWTESAVPVAKQGPQPQA